MLQQVLRIGSQARPALTVIVRRNLGASSVVMAKTKAAAGPTDPVQKLFVDKIRDYSNKKKSAGGKLVDSDPQTEKEMATEIGKLNKMFGGGDMTQFPTFEFKDIDFGAEEKK
ncbi:ATP synthase-coupling factor 6, mitochondrial [Strongylocentrotus purpuratus]|uniref:ATP synthase-coupling factor 6, mitochondrial n=1 Tax=Strongylocentrotus purpuratus TaxID=7668 RepID=A0A7M7RBL9_STRPU|nr:ATP synthase-coupling factor 6, mitochondrial [Strongylocentrotus purpuratus]|eukprot:XP_785948.1 PREDICTED: ATP synthase-coupling factor 6, mitochondrial [Strongylocentrotus purpuratus]